MQGLGINFWASKNLD